MGFFKIYCHIKRSQDVFKPFVTFAVKAFLQSYPAFCHPERSRRAFPQTNKIFIIPHATHATQTVFNLPHSAEIIPYQAIHFPYKKTNIPYSETNLPNNETLLPHTAIHFPNSAILFINSAVIFTNSATHLPYSATNNDKALQNYSNLIITGSTN